jgi:Tfp pilus assembly protein PilN
MRAVNLIPTEQRGGASVGAGRSGGAAYAVLGLVGGVAVLALLYGIADHQISSRKTEVASLNTRAQQAQAQTAQLAPYTTFIALRQSRQQAVETLVDSRFDWAHAFHEFGRVLPRTASINSLTGTVGSATAAASGAGAAPKATGAAAGSSGGSVTPPGSVPAFTVAGCASSQGAVADTINRLRLIDGVSSVSLISSTKSASGGGTAGAGAGSGSCGSFPAYNLQVAFQPLPATATAAAAATTRTVSATPSSGATSGAAGTAAGASSTGASK